MGWLREYREARMPFDQWVKAIGIKKKYVDSGDAQWLYAQRYFVFVLPILAFLFVLVFVLGVLLAKLLFGW